MAIRNSIRVDVLVKRAAELQDADAELNEVERILRMEEIGDRRLLPLLRRAAQQRRHLLLAVRQPLLEQVSGDAIARCRPALGRGVPSRSGRSRSRWCAGRAGG